MLFLVPCSPLHLHNVLLLQLEMIWKQLSVVSTGYQIIGCKKLGVFCLSFPHHTPGISAADDPSVSQSVFTIKEKPPTRAFSWLKAATTAFTFRTLLRHYAKRALTPRSLNVKLGPQRNYHEGRAAIRHYANQPACPLWPLCRRPNFTMRDRWVNACLA